MMTAHLGEQVYCWQIGSDLGPDLGPTIGVITGFGRRGLVSVMIADETCYVAHNVQHVPSAAIDPATGQPVVDEEDASSKLRGRFCVPVASLRTVAGWPPCPPDGWKPEGRTCSTPRA
jgi:hypothetical protein